MAWYKDSISIPFMNVALCCYCQASLFALLPEADSETRVLVQAIYLGGNRFAGRVVGKQEGRQGSQKCMHYQAGPHHGGLALNPAGNWYTYSSVLCSKGQGSALACHDLRFAKAGVRGQRKHLGKELQVLEARSLAQCTKGRTWTALLAPLPGPRHPLPLLPTHYIPPQPAKSSSGPAFFRTGSLTMSALSNFPQSFPRVWSTSANQGVTRGLISSLPNRLPQFPAMQSGNGS